jgi:hypothetical protein
MNALTTAESEKDCNLPQLEGEYNLQFHIASIFILASVSLIGASLPIVGKSMFRVSWIRMILFKKKINFKKK